MEQQMNLFEEGGMKDDGLKKDPISGNEIPPGSLAKEVRDDIPAQLSDGEYVVPAGIVSALGNGSSDAGGKVLDGMVERVGSTGQSHKVPGDSIDLGRVLPA